MPIDIEKAVGGRLPPSSFSWDEEDVILYHLGLGAGSDPVDPGELRYVYEGDLIVMPTYANIPPFSMLMGMVAVEGIDVTLAQILHGEQETIVHSVLPTSGTVENEGSIVDVYDKGKSAVALVEIVSRLTGSDVPLFTNRSSIFLKGEGGFGGDPGPSGIIDCPERDPDHVVESPTLPQQALLYRMASGDKNPLHADPGFAAFAGYERPILHGLCTYGIVCKAAVDTALDGDPGSVAGYRARFSGVVFPGETIVTRIWEEDDRLLAVATVAERDQEVLTNVAIDKR